MLCFGCIPKLNSAALKRCLLSRAGRHASEHALEPLARCSTKGALLHRGDLASKPNLRPVRTGRQAIAQWLAPSGGSNAFPDAALYFATGNPHKFREASGIFAQYRIPLQRFSFRHGEIRSDRLAEIAEEAVHAAYAECRQPVFVEDSGLFVDALNGFPGTYSAWVYRKIGTAGMLRLMEGIRNRRAHFEAAVAFTDGKRTRTFTGRCNGRLAYRERGNGGFGYDPIFIPTGYRATFAESISLKNKLSHRFKSLRKLISYWIGNL